MMCEGGGQSMTCLYRHRGEVAEV